MKFVLTKSAKVGDVLFYSAKTFDGIKILKKGTILSKANIALLRNNNIRGITICTDNYESRSVSCEDILETRINVRLESLSTRYVQRALEREDVRNLVENLSDHVRDHSINVANYVALLLSRSSYNIAGKGSDIIIGALLHDIGKDSIPTDIMFAPRRLSDIEFDIVKLHTQIGYAILKEHNYSSIVTEIAIGHHESADGKGYPHGKSNEDIPWYVDLVHICDIYDALCSKRIYKSSSMRSEAKSVIMSQKDKFKPEIYNLFVDNIPECFLGDLLATNTDEVYEVIGYSDNKEPILRNIYKHCDVLLSELGSNVIPVDKIGGAFT